MSTIMIVEAMNLFCGDHDPSASNHLSLETMKLPDLEMGSMEHRPGGGPMAINFTMANVNALESSFKLKGIDPNRLTLFGLGSNKRRKFTGYGVVRDKRTNDEKEAVVIMEGVLARIGGGEFSKGNGMDFDYAIREIVSYKLTIDADPVYDLDVFLPKFIIGGVDQLEASNRILRIPGAA